MDKQTRHSDDLVKQLMAEREVLRATWQDAYAAFKGAFDTPVARRKVDDEYATDARERLAALNEMLSIEMPALDDALPALGDVLSTSKAPRARQTI